MITALEEKIMKSGAGMKIRSLLLMVILIVASVVCSAQPGPAKSWSVLEAGLQEKSVSGRVTAVRVLGLIHEDPHAAELAENALKDSNASVRAAAATALGQMHATAAEKALKQALSDKQLSVVLAAAHALQLLNDPACYEVYYEILTGERKDNSGMVAQEMKTLRDPKQLAQMGFAEGIGFVPFASMGWEAEQTITKDRKSGTAARVALVSALATDPDHRVDTVLVKETQSPKWVLRVASLEAIAKRANPALLPDVEKLLDDSKNEVKFTAAATIIRLSDVAEAGKAGHESALATEPPELELWRVMSGTRAAAN